MNESALYVFLAKPEKMFWSRAEVESMADRLADLQAEHDRHAPLIAAARAFAKAVSLLEDTDSSWAGLWTLADVEPLAIAALELQSAERADD